MQCGPVRHQIATGDLTGGAIARSLEVRETAFAVVDAEAPIHELFRLLVENEERNTLVCDDILDALARGRRCLVLSQWKEHCNLLAEGLLTRGVAPVGRGRLLRAHDDKRSVRVYDYADVRVPVLRAMHNSPARRRTSSWDSASTTRQRPPQLTVPILAA